MNKDRFPKFKSKIDEIDLKNEQVKVRGINITELIETKDFTEIIYHILLNKNPTYKEKKLLDASLISIHAGFQAYPPTVLFPRIAASTGAPLAQAIAAGYCSSGESHLGAIRKSMIQYESIKGQILNKNYYIETKKIIETKIKDNQKLFGFGHPVLTKDPRPETLRNLTKKLNYNHPYLEIFDGIKDVLYETKKVQPNVDGINSAILLSLGFKPEHGEGLFLFSRTLGMIAHFIEEKEQPPWSGWRNLVGREMIDNLLN
ncbi:MAG: hypothetical protein PF542_02765 [Nanoarchaeota archaeon]|jgi:citrate synthase|nr:hypothetical protein [Nanoarchaeota archaeon]